MVKRTRVIKTGGLRVINQALAELAEKGKDKGDLVTRASIIEIYGSIIKEWVVAFEKGGRSRGNWFLTIGSPSSQRKDTGFDKNKDQNYVIRQTPSKPLGKKIFLTNNQPYAQVLEFGLYPGPSEKVNAAGFSKLMPTGTVRKNVARFGQIIRQIAAKNK